MSVLIKGVKMPTSCYDCNCFIRDSDGSDYCCLLMLDIEDNDKRNDDCPLIPVPPHGKWKDAMQSCHDSPHVKCSVCGEYYWRYFKKFNFCPNCGADMRGDDDGT